MNATAAHSPKVVRPLRTVDMIDVELLIPSEDNPRVELKDLEGLAESIRSCGIIQPLIVREAKEKGKFEIVAGHRRHEAAKMAGKKEVPCVKTLVGTGSLESHHLIENTQRSDLTPLEIGMGVYVAIFNGKKQKDLSKILGKSEAWVSKYNTIGQAADKATVEQMKDLIEENDGEKCYVLAQQILGRGGSVSTSKEKSKQPELPLPDSIDQVLAMRQKDKKCGLIEELDAPNKYGAKYIVAISFENEEEAIKFFS